MCMQCRRDRSVDNAPVVTPKENVGVDILIKMMNELGKNCGFEKFFGFFCLKMSVLEK